MFISSIKQFILLLDMTSVISIGVQYWKDAISRYNYWEMEEETYNY
jgi:hypothetical protein